MPPIKETLASFLSVGEASALKAQSLPTKPLHVTSRLNSRAYVAAGQAGVVRHTTDLVLCATKQTVATIGRSMEAMVAMERHL